MVWLLAIWWTKKLFNFGAFLAHGSCFKRVREAFNKKKTRKVEIFFRKKGGEVRHKLNNFNFLGLLFFEGFPKQGDRD